MRLAGQLRGGFYPAPAEAVALAARFLRAPRRGSPSLLDPCAGEGAALRQLAGLLGCPPEQTHAIELDEDRAATLRAALPGARLLAPASFFGCRASPGSFSLIWLNPPFDDGYGGHRVEDQFLRAATGWLVPGGVMALVCPEPVAREGADVRRHFASCYQDCSLVPFPARQRRFHEVIVFGRKRARPRATDSGTREPVLAPADFVYQLPTSDGPRVFEKVEPTEPELARMLAGSPLRSRLRAPADSALPRPPLPLGTGHVALLLAAGQLDGIVHPDGQLPHVVRGTSRKSAFVADVTETVNDDGSTTTKTTISERIELVVRTIDRAGNLRTFRDTAADAV